MSDVLELESTAGFHILAVCEQAAAKATEANQPVHFVFNGTDVTVQPGESPQVAQDRWQADFDAAAKAWRESPERAIEEAKRDEEMRVKMAAHMTEAATSEAEMRTAKVPWPYTKEQLVEYIQSLVERQHDYGTCVYAMSMASQATFNYASHCLGVTGFQASCADLDFIRRTRSMNGPFILLKAEDMLYPQYDLEEKLEEAMTSWQSWLKEQAAKMLGETDHAHPDVIAHWKELAK